MTENIDAIKEQFYPLHLRGHGRADEAIEIYRRRLEIEPHCAIMRMELAVTLSQKGDRPEALREARIAIADDPGNPALRILFANLLVQNEQWQEAIAECKEQLRMRPEHAHPRLSLGDAYYGVGDLNAAIASYEVAIGLGYRDCGSHDTLGRFYEEAGRLDDAIRTYRELLEFAPRFRMGRLHLGKALAASGKVAEARDEWKRILADREAIEGAQGHAKRPPDEATILASEYMRQYA
jgi:tetratricopeptide (TPR) repeat protein